MDIADKLADMGYVAFAADIYGKGVRPANNQEAAAEATKYNGIANCSDSEYLLGWKNSRKNPHVDQRSHLQRLVTASGDHGLGACS